MDLVSAAAAHPKHTSRPTALVAVGRRVADQYAGIGGELDAGDFGGLGGDAGEPADLALDAANIVERLLHPGGSRRGSCHCLGWVTKSQMALPSALVVVSSDGAK